MCVNKLIYAKALQLVSAEKNTQKTLDLRSRDNAPC